MRTGPVALCSLLSCGTGSARRRHLCPLPTPVPMPSRRAVLWTDAIRRAIERPSRSSGHDRLGRPCVRGPRSHARGRRPLWSDRLQACYTAPPEEFTPNGYVVTALLAALSSLAQTPVSERQPCRHLRLAIERVVRIGDDTDTVAAITGSLAGAYWGATAVPLEWRSMLNGRVTYATPRLSAADLDRMGRLAANDGADDNIGWPTIESLLPYYASRFPGPTLAEPIDRFGDRGQRPRPARPVCRTWMWWSPCAGWAATTSPKASITRSSASSTPLPPTTRTWGFVLADTADYLARCASAGKRVFVHCVRAENRTPAVAAALPDPEPGDGT